MSYYKNIISDTLFGGNVNTFAKNSTNVGEQIKSDQLKTMFEEGLSMITLFRTFIFFDILTLISTILQNYNNPGKYPIFIALGCNAGNLYNFNQQRLSRPRKQCQKDLCWLPTGVR